MNNKKYYILILSTILLFNSCVSIKPTVVLWEDLQYRYKQFNLIENFEGWDIEHYYAAIGTKEEMLEVISYSESLESTDFNDNTPVMISQMYNNLESYEALLSEGCSLNWLNCFSTDKTKAAYFISLSYGYITENDLDSNKKELPNIILYDMVPPDLEYNYFSKIKEYPFRPYNTFFSKVNAWFLSECSFLAYASPAFAQQVYNKAGYENFKFIGIDDNECMVVWNDESIIITFRGTEQNSSSTISDIITDSRAIQVPYKKGCNIHRGFLSAFNTIWNGEDGLASFIDKLKKDKKKRAIWVTGHSLGGALADICFTEMEDATGLYTFGAPRIGNKEFLELTAGRPMWRVEHNQDPVTTVPFSIPYIHFYYYNLGDLIYIGKYGEVIDLSDTEYSKNNLNYTQTYIEQDFLKVMDHMPIYYSIKLWNSFNK